MKECKYCSKQCKNNNSLINHERLCKNNPNKGKTSIKNARKILANTPKLKCRHCAVLRSKGNLKKHELTCRLNPEYIEANLKICPSCNVEHFKKGITCSRSCSNKWFRTGLDSGAFTGKRYRSICFNNISN